MKNEKVVYYGKLVYNVYIVNYFFTSNQFFIVSSEARQFCIQIIISSLPLHNVLKEAGLKWLKYLKITNILVQKDAIFV